MGQIKNPNTSWFKKYFSRCTVFSSSLQFDDQ